MAAGGERFLHRGNHEGRTHPRAHHVETAGGFQPGIRGHRRRHQLCPEETGGDEAEKVAAQRLAVFVGHQRPIAVAVRRYDRVKRQLVRPVGHQPDRFVGDSLGIDRDELLGTAERKDGGAVMLEHLDHHVAGNRAVLVDADAQALQSLRRQYRGVAREKKVRRRPFLVLGRPGFNPVCLRIV